MITTSLSRAALAGALILCAALPAGASGAARSSSEALYEVTFRAEMTDRWQMREHYEDDCKLTGAMCVRHEEGSGTARLNVKTRRPTRMLVMRGTGGRPPMLNVGTGEGAPVVGPYLRTGTLKTEYSGPWDAANPDREAPTSGCGTKTLKGDVNFTWRAKNQLAPLAILDDDREDCPTGPSIGWEWEGGESPSLSDAIAQAAQSKFPRTKQFSVNGNRTWTAIVDPINRQSKNGSYVRDGSRTTTWQWTATWRMVKRR